MDHNSIWNEAYSNCTFDEFEDEEYYELLERRGRLESYIEIMTAIYGDEYTPEEIEQYVFDMLSGEPKE